MLLRPYRILFNSIAKRKHADGSRDKPPRKHVDPLPEHAGMELGRSVLRVKAGEECKRQHGLHRYSTKKRKTKDRVSSLLNRDGDEVMKGTEKHEVLAAFFSLVFTGKISSQVSHTPEARLWGKEILTTSEEDQVRDKLHI